MNKDKKKRLLKRNIFIFLMLLLPVLRFLLSQFLNFNMVFMAFNDYTLGANHPVFVGWENFKDIFNMFEAGKIDTEWIAVKNSFSIMLLILFVNAPLSLIFAYLCYSKVPGYKWMQVLLYFPAITAGVVLALIFKSFMQSGPMDSIYNLLGIYDKLPNEGWFGPKTAWNTILVFSVWTGFSSNFLFFLSAMNRVPKDLIEAAKLDGASKPRLFFSIVFPLISSTVATMLTFAMTIVFGWCMPSVYFTGSEAGINNTGALGLTLLRFTKAKNYGVAAAYGLLLTLIGVPVILGVRALGNRLQKNVEF